MTEEIKGPKRSSTQNRFLNQVVGQFQDKKALFEQFSSLMEQISSGLEEQGIFNRPSQAIPGKGQLEARPKPQQSDTVADSAKIQDAHKTNQASEYSNESTSYESTKKVSETLEHPNETHESFSENQAEDPNGMEDAPKTHVLIDEASIETVVVSTLQSSEASLEVVPESEGELPEEPGVEESLVNTPLQVSSSLFQDVASEGTSKVVEDAQQALVAKQQNSLEATAVQAENSGSISVEQTLEKEGLVNNAGDHQALIAEKLDAASLEPAEDNANVSTVAVATTASSNTVLSSGIDKAVGKDADKIGAVQASDKSNLNSSQNVSANLSLRKNEEGTSTKREKAQSVRNFSDRTLERVDQALREAVKSKDGKTISIRLDPPSLGSVKVDVSLRDGHLHARFVAESASVAWLLRDKSHEVHNMLRKAGLSFDTVSVSVGNEGTSEEFSFASHQGFHSEDDGRRDSSSGSSYGDQTFGKSNEQFREKGSKSAIADHWIA